MGWVLAIMAGIGGTFATALARVAARADRDHERLLAEDAQVASARSRLNGRSLDSRAHPGRGPRAGRPARWIEGQTG